MSSKIQDILKENWVLILLIVLLILGERTIGTAEVHGISMEKNYHNGDLLLVKRTDRVKVGDVVAIWSDDLNEFLCKRVIGVEGDNIVITNGQLYRNHKLIREDFIREQNWGAGIDTAFIVPDDCIYVMGDNRNYSTDSRNLGSFNKNKIYGKSLMNLTQVFGIKKKTIWVSLLIVWLTYIIYLLFKGRYEKDTEVDISLSSEEKLRVREILQKLNKVKGEDK